MAFPKQDNPYAFGAREVQLDVVPIAGTGDVDLRCTLSNKRIIRPLEERLALAGTAGPVTGVAIVPDLRGMTAEGPPAFDLESIYFR